MTWGSFKRGYMFTGFADRQSAHRLAGEYANKTGRPWFACLPMNGTNFVCDEAWLRRHCTDLEPDDYFKVIPDQDGKP